MSLFPLTCKPLKAPSRVVNFDELPWDLGLVSSPKKDGNRGLCISGRLYTSSMKSPRNPLLADFLQPLIELAEEEDLVFDYELYDPEGSHHAILSGAINSDGHKLPESLHCFVFDGMPVEAFNEQCVDFPYAERINFYRDKIQPLRALGHHIIPLEQRQLANAEEAREIFRQDLLNGDEGSMIRAMWISGDPAIKRTLKGGWYKHGRATPCQGVIFKYKNFVTHDAIIKQVIPRRKLKDGVPRTYDDRGHLEPINFVECFESERCVGAFVVEDEEGIESRIGFSKGFALDERHRMWQQYEQQPEMFIGKWIEFRHMPHGSQPDGKRRFGQLVRFREDKDV